MWETLNTNKIYWLNLLKCFYLPVCEIFLPYASLTTKNVWQQPSSQLALRAASFFPVSPSLNSSWTALHAVLQTWVVNQHLNAPCKQTLMSVCCSFCEKLVLSWIMAAWTEDAAYANIEQQYCRVHFSKWAKASEKHYHGLTLVSVCEASLVFVLWVQRLSVAPGEVYVYADWAFCSGIFTHWKSQCSYLFYIVFFLFIMSKTVGEECLPSTRSSFH